MTRRTSLAWLLVMIAFSLDAQPADACGLKLTGKSNKSPKYVSQSDNPSRILIIGDPGSNLERTLERAGHYVEVVSEPYEIKSKDFRVVLVDEASAADAARVNYPGADVISLNKDVRQCLSSVEKTLSREPTGAMAQRPVVAVKEGREPVARSANAQEGRTLVAASAENETVPVTLPKRSEPSKVEESAPVEVARAEQPVARENAVLTAKVEAPVRVAVSTEVSQPVKRETKAEQPKPAPSRRSATSAAERDTADAGEKGDDNVFFAISSTRLSARTLAHLNKHLAWLKANPNGSLRLEGHTDALGPQDHNLALSERRLQSVWNFFAENGIADGRGQLIARGESAPVFDPPENPNNRCVVIHRE